MRVRLWMAEDVITIGRSQTIHEAEILMIENNLRRVPVVEKGTLLGIISDTDIIKSKPSELDPFASDAAEEHAMQIPVEQIMTDEPITVMPETPIEEAVRKMRNHKINSIPVVEQSRLVGILTETDVFNAFMQVFGVGAAGTRFELLLNKNKGQLQRVLAVLEQEKIEIIALSLYDNYSDEQQLVTLKVGVDKDAFPMDELWEMGVTITTLSDNQTT